MTTAKWYGLGMKHALTDVNLASDTIKAALVTSGYTPNQDTDEFWSTPQGNEASGTGYTAGGATVSGVAVTYTGATNVVEFTFSNVTWTSSTITARYLVIYKSTGTAATSPLIAWQDAGSDISSSSGTFTFTPDATGVLTVTVS